MSSSLRVLVVDDSAFNRRTLGEMLGAMPGVEVVGKASDGDEALRLAASLTPDLITLDLEMPRMDGFTFLRLLMARSPTPVIVVSGYANRENVFRALELGALDFIAKPSRSASTDLSTIGTELLAKVQLVRHLTPSGVDPERRFGAGGLDGRIRESAAHERKRAREESTIQFGTPPRRAPRRVLVVGASTGGPTALLVLFARLPADAAVIVAQHMPQNFTKTFAERLDRAAAVRVMEATSEHALLAGTAYVAPGGRCVELDRRGEELVCRVTDPNPGDRYVPSIDRLFSSSARVAQDRVIAMVLTGMGDDGARGAVEVKKAGGIVLAEAPESAVIYGMPGATARTGSVDTILPVARLAEHVAKLLADA